MLFPFMSQNINLNLLSKTFPLWFLHLIKLCLKLLPHEIGVQVQYYIKQCSTRHTNDGNMVTEYSQWSSRGSSFQITRNIIRRSFLATFGCDWIRGKIGQLCGYCSTRVAFSILKTQFSSTSVPTMLKRASTHHSKVLCRLDNNIRTHVTCYGCDYLQGIIAVVELSYL